MKEFFEKRGQLIHLISLILIVISVFVYDNVALKFGILLLGIIGLCASYYFKGKKSLFYFFVFLMIVAVAGFVLMQNGLIPKLKGG